MTLALATSTNPRRLANAALSREPPLPRRGRWAVARIAASPSAVKGAAWRWPAPMLRPMPRSAAAVTGPAGVGKRANSWAFTTAPRAWRTLANAKPWPASRVR